MTEIKGIHKKSKERESDAKTNLEEC